MSNYRILGSLFFAIFLYSFPWVTPAAEPEQRPAKIDTIKFQGNKSIGDDELKKLTGLTPGKPLDPAAVKKASLAVVRKYNDLKYAFTTCEIVKSNQPGDTEIVFKITEGPLVRFRDVSFSGNQAVKAFTLMQIIQVSKANGENYDLRDMEPDMTAVAQFYHALGYLEAVVAREVIFNEQLTTARIVLHVTEGPRSLAADVITPAGGVYLLPVPKASNGQQPTVIQVQYEGR